MSREEIKEILERFKDGNANEADHAFLESWYNHFSERELELLSAVERVAAVDLAWKGILAAIEEQELELSGDKARVVKMPVDIRREKGRGTNWRRWIAAAAVVIVLIGVGVYKYREMRIGQVMDKLSYQNDVAPGKVGATLTLDNGKQILLSNAANGELAKESGVVITKTEAGELIYEIKDNTTSSQSMNTLATAKGETYQVILPDGSKVWLNAVSSLKYPARFTALKERRVSLNGEAYFEVAKDKSHPFIVATAKQDVEVLGTHFNVNAYQDEGAVKTTLLEGSVKVAARIGKGLGSIVLKPGEQSTLGNGEQINVATADTDQAIAWKEGKFVFEDENIESIMRKLSRWYNVEVVYQDDLTGRTFDGSISRSDNISKILEKITFTQVAHFKIEGRRVTVMK